MRQLSAHDAAFLHADTSRANSNLTLIQIYDQSTAPGGKVRFKSILAHVESRLGGLPMFRSRLQRVPLDLDHPYWVDDPDFDLEYHVRHIALPKPGDWRQFCIQASRIHARALDLSRPLWEMYVIEGLDSLLELPEGSFALLTKIHHSVVDAEGGSRIAMLLHDVCADAPAPAPPAPWFPQAEPAALELLWRGGMNVLRDPLRPRTPLGRRLLRNAGAAYRFAGDLLLRPEQLLATRFNAVVSPHRVFDTRRFALEDFKRLRTLVKGATVNDVVLAVCGGALRRYLDAQGELPAHTLSAVAPIHVRGGADGAAPQLSWLHIELGTQLGDARARLDHIRAQTAASVTIGQAFGARELSETDPHAAAATLARTGRLQAQVQRGPWPPMPNASCTITNVPGPAVPLYLNGARMSYFSAIMPIHDGMGLVFAVTSYDGRIIISPTSCRELLPDPLAFTQHLRDAFQEMLALLPRSARPRASATGSASRPPRTAGKAATAPRAARAGRRRSATPAD